MTDRKFPWQNVLNVTYDRLLTGFDDDGIVIGLADDDQGDIPVPVLRWTSDDTAGLLGDLLAFVASGGAGYTGGQSRAYGLTRDGDDLVLLTPINAETVVAVRIPVDAVPTVIAALQQAQDGRDDVIRFDETMRHAHPGDFDRPSGPDDRP